MAAKDVPQAWWCKERGPRRKWIPLSETGSSEEECRRVASRGPRQAIAASRGLSLCLTCTQRFSAVAQARSTLLAEVFGAILGRRQASRRASRSGEDSEVQAVRAV